MRVWFNGRMTHFQCVDPSSILGTRTKQKKPESFGSSRFAGRSGSGNTAGGCGVLLPAVEKCDGVEREIQGEEHRYPGEPDRHYPTVDNRLPALHEPKEMRKPYREKNDSRRFVEFTLFH